jgi:hypothetical protein
VRLTVHAVISTEPPSIVAVLYHIMWHSSEDKTMDAIEADDESGPNLADVWKSLDTPIYRVLNEEGANMWGAVIRRLSRGSYGGHEPWLYSDEQDGYLVLSGDDVASFVLVPEDKFAGG